MGIIILWILYVLVIVGCLVWSVYGAVKSDISKHSAVNDSKIEAFEKWYDLEDWYSTYNQKTDPLKGLL